MLSNAEMHEWLATPTRPLATMFRTTQRLMYAHHAMGILITSFIGPTTNDKQESGATYMMRSITAPQKIQLPITSIAFCQTASMPVDKHCNKLLSLLSQTLTLHVN